LSRRMNLQLDKGGLKGEERGFIAGRSLYVCICLLMVILGYTFRSMQNEIASMNLPWYDEPYPDHSTIHRAYQETPKEYLDTMLERVASFPLHQRGREGGRKEY